MAVQLKFDDSFFKTGRFKKLNKTTREHKKDIDSSNSSITNDRSFNMQRSKSQYLLKKGKSNWEGLKFYQAPQPEQPKLYWKYETPEIVHFKSNNPKNMRIHKQLDNLQMIDKLFKSTKMKHLLKKSKQEKQKKISNYVNFMKRAEIIPQHKEEENKVVNKENQLSLSNFIVGNSLTKTQLTMRKRARNPALPESEFDRFPENPLNFNPVSLHLQTPQPKGRKSARKIVRRV